MPPKNVENIRTRKVEGRKISFSNNNLGKYNVEISGDYDKIKKIEIKQLLFSIIFGTVQPGAYFEKFTTRFTKFTKTRVYQMVLVHNEFCIDESQITDHFLIEKYVTRYHFDVSKWTTRGEVA